MGHPVKSMSLMIIAASALLLNVPETRAAGAGRAFPVESENFAIENFRSINPLVEWDPTNFLIDLSGEYANCNYLNRKGEQIVADRKTPEGETVTILIDVVPGKASDVDAVNTYIRDMITRWVADRQFSSQIRGAKRVGCSVRPSCSGSAVIACVFSAPSRGGDGTGEKLRERATARTTDVQALRGRPTMFQPRPTNRPENELARTAPAFKQNALAFTPDQYNSAERIMGKKWDRSHYLENLSGYETDCAMIGLRDWPFSKMASIAKDQGITATGQFGSEPNEGSTQAALDKILAKFRGVTNAKDIGCSIIPDCRGPANKMYVVISCLYEESRIKA